MMFRKTRIRCLLGLGALTLVLFAQPYRSLIIVGPSMEPTYVDHTLVLTTAPGAIRRGDVVVLRAPGGDLVVKRVAFLQGDRLWQVHVYDGWQTVLMNKFNHHASPLTRTITIPKGEIFVLGDNYTDSVDSRQFGCVPLSSVVSQVANPKPAEEMKPLALAQLEKNYGR